jgi:hypothetical protein
VEREGLFPSRQRFPKRWRIFLRARIFGMEDSFPHPIAPRNRNSLTMTRRAVPISHQRAKDAAMRLIHSHFGQPDHARISIPLNLDDDDVVIMDYIEQQLIRELDLDSARPKLASDYIPPKRSS